MHPNMKLLFLMTSTLLTGQALSFTVGNKMEGTLSVVKNGLKVVHRHLDLSGHEEITRQGIILAQKAAERNGIVVPKDLSEMAFQNLKPKEFGLIGAEATNPLIQGNYATDFPFTKKDNVVDLPKYWNFTELSDNMDWQNHPKTQKFHFLRDHHAAPDERGSMLVGQRKSCYATRDAIIKVTREASAIYRKTKNDQGQPLSKAERVVNLKKTLFFLGHATHMLQDSFSEAHGQRDTRVRNSDLKEICYFGFDDDILRNPREHSTRFNSCHHSVDEIIRDGLWLKDTKGINRVKSEWPGEPVVEDSVKGIYSCLKNFTLKLTENDTCLKHTPRLARTATAKYLLVLIQYMKFDNKTVSGPDHMKNFLMENFFEGSLGLIDLDEAMPSGVMRCDNLPE